MRAEELRQLAVLQLGEPGDLARILTIRAIANRNLPLAHNKAADDLDA